MGFSGELRSARLSAGLTQADVSALTGIARPNVAAYEADRREPRISTAEVLLNATGASLIIDAPVEWSWTESRRPYAVPSRLWRLPAAEALRQFETGTHLWWSGPSRTFDLSQRSDRLRAYEIVLREGTPEDIAAVVDEVLLCESWRDLVLPADLRDAWQPLVDNELSTASAETAAA